MNGKRDGFTLADFRTCAKSALRKRGRAEGIVEECVPPWRNGRTMPSRRRWLMSGASKSSETTVWNSRAHDNQDALQSIDLRRRERGCSEGLCHATRNRFRVRRTCLLGLANSQPIPRF
jgi:hypothetical protein